MRWILTTVFPLLIFAFGSTEVYSQQSIPKDLTITLKRTSCFGWCPSYELTIKSDGSVTFTPSGQFVYRGTGKDPSLPITWSIGPERLQKLLAEFRKIGFYSLRKRYGDEHYRRSSSCPEVWTDNPYATVSIAEKGKQKSVHHYLGCSGASILADLEALENEIDEISNGKEWISRYGWNTANVIDVRIQKKH